ncbi:hypothetical protein B5F32_05365 [Parabacteroides distasonis]|uniref:Acyltransferase 3 domain-containing protein n=1 Tax=Parabacteroides distasonis TaxID=823 RepID=A0A1Y4ILN9_PARDI|nr:acyltransferase family protein [Parabacteroides distasonis]OUP21234.1 hypothetical protein B5F32_05365 [Parabacteroides distasonis]
MITTRIKWIDTCKGLAIFLVVLGHALRNDISYIYIYSFHMPLFFFLSGLVLNRSKYTFKNFLKSRFATLILPYIFFYLLTYIYWLLIENHFRSFDMAWYKPLLGMVYGAQYSGLMDHNGILWFLPCLFVVEMSFFAVSTLKKIELQVVVVILVLAVGSQIKIVLPWCLNIAMCALPFFYVGNIFRQKIVTDGREENSIVRFLFLGGIYGFACYFFPNRIAMAVNFYGEIPLFIFFAFVGIGMLISFSKAVDRVRFKFLCDGVLQYLGCNTLVIFALHQPVLRILTFVSKKLFADIPLESNIFFSMGVSIVVIFWILPLIKLYKMFVEPQLRKLYL